MGGAKKRERRLSRKWTVVALLLMGNTASPQILQIGGRVMGGAMSISSGGAAAGAPVGVEACVWCGGRFGLFGEYTHWFSAERAFWTDRVRSADLAGAGLRVQWLRKVPVFLDAGLVAGRDQHTLYAGGAMGGLVVGAGLHLRVSERWYVRPQFRMYGLSPHSLEGMGLHWAAVGGVGVGASF